MTEERTTYAIFEFDNYYPDGGAYDFKYFSKQPIEVIKESYRNKKYQNHQDDFYVQIVDYKTMEIVCQGKFSRVETWDWDDTWSEEEEEEEEEEEGGEYICEIPPEVREYFDKILLGKRGRDYV